MSFDITQYFGKVKVLDKGHIDFFDGMVQDPRLKIANAARVSFNKEVNELSDKDIKLIDFLFKHEHFSTFRHSYFSFRVKAPLMVFRQWWKYQIASDWVENENVGTIQLPETNWNEMSGRYVEFEPEFYIPHTIRRQSKNNKQGSDGELQWLQNGEDPMVFFEESCKIAYERYLYMVRIWCGKRTSTLSSSTEYLFRVCLDLFSPMSPLFSSPEAKRRCAVRDTTIRKSGS